jgi:hypothetical protein
VPGAVELLDLPLKRPEVLDLAEIDVHIEQAL